MLVDLHDADGGPVTVDLSEIKTVEPDGTKTILHFADGTRVIVSEVVQALKAADQR